MSIFRICAVIICFALLLVFTGFFLHIMMEIAPIPTLLGIIICMLISLILFMLFLPPYYFGEKDAARPKTPKED